MVLAGNLPKFEYFRISNDIEGRKYHAQIIEKDTWDSRYDFDDGITAVVIEQIEGEGRGYRWLEAAADYEVEKTCSLNHDLLYSTKKGDYICPWCMD